MENTLLSTELILVNTPPDYGHPRWTERLLEQLMDNLKYDTLRVINDIEFGGVYDKLRIFDIGKENKQYIYLDLDIVIHDNINHLLRKNFTLLHAWWRDPFHTPLNSSVMSWQGDYSHIYDKFAEDPDYYMVKYNKGIDEYIYKEIDYYVYDKVCDSYNWPSDREVGEYPITLYNQAKDMIWKQEYMPYE